MNFHQYHIKLLNDLTQLSSTIIHNFTFTMFYSWHQYFINKTLPILTNDIQDFNRTKLFIAGTIHGSKLCYNMLIIIIIYVMLTIIYVMYRH